MTYTFWHRGILIGESPLNADSPEHPGHRTGDFYPTKHGLTVFPRLAGYLTASHEVRMHLDENESCADDLEPDDVEALFNTFPAGRRYNDIVRALSEVEVQASDGTWLEVESIVFTDVVELRTLAHRFAVAGAIDPVDIPPEPPRQIVSATFISRMPHDDILVPELRRRGQEADN